jgi:hypothetical protein
MKYSPILNDFHSARLLAQPRPCFLRSKSLKSFLIGSYSPEEQKDTCDIECVN